MIDNINSLPTIDNQYFSIIGNYWKYWSKKLLKALSTVHRFVKGIKTD